ncbi:MAG: thioredoxin family protein [Actinobacteria bacterium]|nr:thioredoxin family protein [Actinomycetota bacterium]MBW3649185.1 thioredoxin family protein [Actinomycetota bacterium]
MKILVVAVFVVALVIGRRWYTGWRVALQQEQRPHPQVPSSLLAGADRTWLVFTTPYCASCGPVKEHLAGADPEARLVSVDVTREPHLADAFHVRSAPTVLLADAAGQVQARLVGARAVRDYFATV